METSDGVDDYAEYAFVVRERIGTGYLYLKDGPILIVLLDRNTEEVIPYINIKSEGLRDILRAVLNDVEAISLIKEKLSAIIIVFFPPDGNAEVDLDRAKRPFSFPPRTRQIRGEHRQQFGS